MDIEQYNILITEIKSLDLKDITSFHYSIIALDKVLPRDVVDEILKKYFLRNPQKILSYYHIIFNRLTLHEIKPILIFCFEEIKKSIDEGNFLVEKNAGENHFISCFDSYFNFLLTIIIQKSKETDSKLIFRNAFMILFIFSQDLFKKISSLRNCLDSELFQFIFRRA